MMAQYPRDQGGESRHCLLFYRMGDFFEMFFEDAEIASRALGILLTKRGKHLGEDIPMCGVPVARADEYLQKLIAAGLPRGGVRAARRPGGGQEARRQVGGAARRGAAGHARHHHRGNAARRRRQQLPDRAGHTGSPATSRCSTRWPRVDISTGEFFVGECGGGRSAGRTGASRPREVLSATRSTATSTLPRASSTRARPARRCRGLFQPAAPARRAEGRARAWRMLEAFGELQPGRAGGDGRAAEIRRDHADRASAGAARRRGASAAGGALAIDAATRVNLELTRTQARAREGSLLGAIDRTVTAAGARELAPRLSSAR